jgi:hypothetical protein
VNADYGSEWPGQQTADDRAQDPTGAENRKKPLGLAGVDHGVGRPPEEDRLHQGRDSDGDPQHEIDPLGIGEQHRPLGDDDPTQRQRGHQICPTRTEHAKAACERQHGHERCAALQQVHHGERLRPDAVEEQRLNSALANGDAYHREEHQADDQRGQPPFTLVDAQGPCSESHRDHLASRDPPDLACDTLHDQCL